MVMFRWAVSTQASRNMAPKRKAATIETLWARAAGRGRQQPSAAHRWVSIGAHSLCCHEHCLMLMHACIHPTPRCASRATELLSDDEDGNKPAAV